MNIAKTITRTAAILASASLALTAAADLPRLDSTQFEYKYEMNALPTAEDIDGTGANDFTGSSTWSTLESGALKMVMTGGQYFVSDKDNGTAGDAWHVMAPSSGLNGTGYTIEALVKIEAQKAKYAFNIQATTADTSGFAMLNLTTNALYWGSNLITNNFDTTSWHTYRIVREGSGESNRYSVYVDGYPLMINNAAGYSATDVNRIIFGSPGGDYKGTAYMAYLRMSKGAYAPPASAKPTGKAAKKWSGEFPVQYEMNAGDTRFIGNTEGGTDWAGSVDSSAPITQDNGVLSVVLAQGQLAWWKANDSIWSANVGADTAYTLEFKIKITGRWNLSSVGDRVVQFICGNPRDAAVFYVGKSSVTWEPYGAGTYTVINSSDNTDAWHTFRLTYNGAPRSERPCVYTLWRDGEVIGTNLKGSAIYNNSTGFPNLLRWGVVSSTTAGGSFDIDYIRWTTDGAWDYADPPGAFTIIFR